LVAQGLAHTRPTARQDGGCGAPKAWGVSFDTIVARLKGFLPRHWGIFVLTDFHSRWRKQFEKKLLDLRAAGG
jgi:hypothetical protein